MKTLLNPHDCDELLRRLPKLSPTDQPRWGRMSAHQMVVHLSDSLRGSLGEKPVKPYGTIFTRTFLKWVALWTPLRWPPGLKTPPEMDQEHGGTPPTVFAADLDKLRVLIQRFRTWEGEFAPHAFLGKMSRTERMRHAYLHTDHHLRQFGA